MSYRLAFSASSTQDGFGVHTMTRSPGWTVLGDLAEVLQLRVVDVRALLGVDREQPPPLRQLQREVAAGLGGVPAADRGAVAGGEDAQERGQPVVPVVVSGQRVERGRSSRPGRRTGSADRNGPLNRSSYAWLLAVG